MKHLVLLTGGLTLMVLAWGCGAGGRHDSSVTEICPNPRDVGDSDIASKTITASGGKLRHSAPPQVFARARGQSVKLAEGEAEWCGLVSDVFRVVTTDTPLVVPPGETIKIANPLPGEHLFVAGVFLVAVRTEPTPESGHLLRWPFGPGGGARAAEAEHEFRFDDNGLSFRAGKDPGLYVVEVLVDYTDQANRSVSPRRRANYALLLEVKE